MEPKQDNSAKPITDGHDQPPIDEVTKKKIDKHLSDENDTISEEDMRNINTSTGRDTTDNRAFDVDEANEIMKEDSDDDDEPEKEAPTSWEILGE